MKQPRTLKVREVGDHYKKTAKPTIILMGWWLLQAGIKANQKVQVTNPKEGTLVIEVMK